MDLEAKEHWTPNSNNQKNYCGHAIRVLSMNGSKTHIGVFFADTLLI